MACKDFSRTKRTVVELVRESSYGHDPGGGQELVFYESFNPFNMNATTVAMTADIDSYLDNDSIFQGSTAQWDGMIFLHGLESLPHWTLLFEMCGMEKGYAGSNTKFVSTMKRAPSGTLRTYLNSFLHIMTGSRGTFSFSAAAGSLIRTNFNLIGRIKKEDIRVATNPRNSVEGPQLPKFCNAQLKIKADDNITEIVPVVKEVSFVMNSRPELLLEDKEDKQDVLVDFFSDLDSRLNLVIEVSTDRNYLASMIDERRFSVEFNLGPDWNFHTDALGRQTASLVAAPYADAAGIRTYNLAFDLNKEFQLTYFGT